MTSRHPVIEMMDPEMAEILRKKSPVERLAIACGMWESARAIIGGAIRKEHPDWSDAMVNLELARRISHGEVDQRIVNDGKH